MSLILILWGAFCHSKDLEQKILRAAESRGDSAIGGVPVSGGLLAAKRPTPEGPENQPPDRKNGGKTGDST